MRNVVFMEGYRKNRFRREAVQGPETMTEPCHQNMVFGFTQYFYVSIDLQIEYTSPRPFYQYNYFFLNMYF
jgi:hypothetical protein